MLNSPNYLTSVCDLVGASIYNELRLNAQYPLVVVKGSYNTDFSVEDVGLELNKVYSVEEFNAALTKANIMWNSDERFIDKLDSVNISVYASSDERISYNVELYASYRSIGDIIDTKPNNGEVSVYSKINNAVAEIESRTLTDNSERMQNVPVWAINGRIQTACSSNGTADLCTTTRRTIGLRSSVRTIISDFAIYIRYDIFTQAFCLRLWMKFLFLLYQLLLIPVGYIFL